MKKVVYYLLLFSVCMLAFGCNKPKNKKRKKPDVVQASPLGQLPFQKIHSDETNYLIQFIREFPKESYSVHYVRGQGHFYLDNINDYIKNLLRKGVSWEGALAKRMKEKIPLGTTAIDIGAHIGTHTLALSEAVGPSGRVIAFEPQPKLFRELFMNMALNGASNIDFYWAGIGDRVAQIELGAEGVGNEGGSSLTGGTGKFVSLITLDSLHLDNVSLIKIDVEGMENAVIDGAKETLLRNRPTIFIEIFGGVDFHHATPEQHQQIQETIHKLNALNYNVFHLDSHNYLAVPN
jgi:FkbM family methyltransferase